jgi:acyl carrier protein
MSDTLERQVIEIIASAKGLDPDGLSSSTTMEELALDSLDGMSIIFDLENAFEIEISEDAAEKATTVSDLVEGVRQLVAARPAE